MGFKRWRRIPEAGACPWCRMLAGRDVKYSEAGKFHRRCLCTSELEAGHQPGTDTPSTPADAAKVVQARRTTSDYRLAAYRALGVTDPPLPAWVTPRLVEVARMQEAAPRPNREARPSPTYRDLAGTDAVAPKETPDVFYEHQKELDTAACLRTILDIGLRSVRTAHEGIRFPDAVWDEVALTAELKSPQSLAHARWGRLISDGAGKADVVVLDCTQLGLEQLDAEVIALRALSAHGRWKRVDHLLLLGHTEQGAPWSIWAKGGLP